MKSILLSCKKALFPAIMTVISFVLFIALYLFETLTAVEPDYFVGLLFAVPFVCFAAVTHFTYETVLRLTDYPHNSLTACFPAKIPKNAKNVEFHYNPAFMQAGEEYDLKFDTDSDSIDKYIDEFSQKASSTVESGGSFADNSDIYSATYDMFEYTALPGDFTVYMTEDKPNQPDNGHHGEFSLVAVSRQRNEILFRARQW